MFDIFNYLPKSSRFNWFDRKALGLRKVKLCLDTGFIAGPDCQKTYWADSPRSLKPVKSCPYHRTIFTTLDEKYRVCSLCWENRLYKKTNRLFYPPDVAQYLREKGVIVSDIPPHRSNCPAHSESRALRIIYPVEKAKIWIPRDFDGKLQKITLKVAHRIRNRTVYWYLDNIYRGYTTNRHKQAFKLKRGWHRLSVIDSEGNRDQRRFFIAIKPETRRRAQGKQNGFSR
jgi:penicillin-binding protein 1C